MCHYYSGSSREWGTSIRPLKKPTANHPPVILKSNIVTRFKIFEFSTIISGSRNNLQIHRRLPECRIKHLEEDLNKDLQN
jgi:hypothetical protein